MNEYSVFDSYGSDFRAEHTFRTSTDQLANGDYDCEVIEAKIEKNAAGLICRAVINFTPAGGGPSRQADHTYWLNKQAGINDFAAEMAQLGFPSQNWGSGAGKVPLSRAIPDTVAKLTGMRFRATKSSRLGKAVPGQATPPIYHDLRIHGRLTTPSQQAPIQSAVPSYFSSTDIDGDAPPF